MHAGACWSYTRTRRERERERERERDEAAVKRTETWISNVCTRYMAGGISDNTPVHPTSIEQQAVPAHGAGSTAGQ